MIVRNEEANLPACLESVRGLFDEVIVADTGSTDGTKDVARSFGARVFDFPWCDDFAAARNAALARCRGDWAMWLDADDRLEPSAWDGVRKLFRRLRAATPAAYKFPCAIPTAGRPDRLDTHVRLFPRRHGVCWTHRIHERIEFTLQRAGFPTRDVPHLIRHVGYLNESVRQAKLERNARILCVELAERPRDRYVQYLGLRLISDWRPVADDEILEGRAPAGCTPQDAAIGAADRRGRPHAAAALRLIPPEWWAWDIENPPT